jgi:hypothetical protein
MAQNVQIQCINKTPRQDAHDRIKNVGGFNADQTRWQMPQPDCHRSCRGWHV